MVAGWMLIVPKEHFISIGAMPEDLAGEMMDLKRRVASYLQLVYGPLCAFEHGPSGIERKIGCGVDHAHLHLVPIRFDLISAARLYLPEGVQWQDGNLSKCRSAFLQGRDYLYIEQPLGHGQIAFHKEFGSQIFRKAIASRIGMPDQYNWRDYPQHGNIAETIDKFRALPAL